MKGTFATSRGDKKTDRIREQPYEPGYKCHNDNLSLMTVFYRMVFGAGF